MNVTWYSAYNDAKLQQSFLRTVETCDMFLLGHGWEAVFVKVVRTLWDHTTDLQGNSLVQKKIQLTDRWNIPGTPKYKYGRYGRISFINRLVEDRISGMFQGVRWNFLDNYFFCKCSDISSISCQWMYICPKSLTKKQKINRSLP